MLKFYTRPIINTYILYIFTVFFVLIFSYDEATIINKQFKIVSCKTVILVKKNERQDCTRRANIYLLTINYFFNFRLADRRS